MQVHFDALTQDQIQEIRAATEDIIANTGFRVGHRGLRDIARKAGAVVDDSTENVRFPAQMLRELLALGPKSYTIRATSGDTFEIGGGKPGAVAIVTDPWIIDYQTQKPRRPSLQDIKTDTIVAQKIDDVVAISRMDFPVTDHHGPDSTWRALEHHLLHHNKHNHLMATSMESFDTHIGIFEVFAQNLNMPLKGSRLLTVGVPVVSPMFLSGLNGDLLLKSCEYGFPVVPTVCPMAGTTSPYTVASTLLQGNVEVVFMAAMTQLVRPGHPYQQAVGASRTDMANANDMYYTIDKVLWKSAAIQLCKTYGMPLSAECGGTMATAHELQAGAEGMLFMLAAYSGGADVLSGIGSCFNANGMSPEMMVIHTAYLEAAKYISKGIDTTGGRLGVDNIKQAGPSGNFLMDDLTMQFLRGGEFFRNDLFDHSGGHGEPRTMLERAHERVEEMVAGYKSPHSAELQGKIRAHFEGIYRGL